MQPYKSKKEFVANSILYDTEEAGSKINEWMKDGRKVYCIGRNSEGVVVHFYPPSKARVTEEAVQTVIDVLLELHDDEGLLDTLLTQGGLQHASVGQSAIAGLVRMFVEVRDDFDGNYEQYRKFQAKAYREWKKSRTELSGAKKAKSRARKARRDDE